MAPNQRPSQIVREFVATVGLITAPLAARVAFDGNPAPARLLLAQLTSSGRLHRHLCRHSASPRRFAYYTDQPRPVPLRRLRGLFATADFFGRRALGSTPVRPEELKKLVAAVAAGAEPQVPPFRFCYLRTPAGESQSRLSIVWPAMAKDMNTVIADLDAFVSRPEFATWRAFALIGALEITCLFRSYRRAAELQRWLQRRPVVCRVGGPTVCIPVLVHPAAILR